MQNSARRSQKQISRAKSLDHNSANIIFESSPGVFYDGPFLPYQHRKVMTFPPSTVPPNMNLKAVRLMLRTEEKEMCTAKQKCLCVQKRETQLSLQNGAHPATKIKDHEVETEAKILRRSSMRYIGHWYYPEGGWGYNVLVAVCLMNIITTGLVFSCPAGLNLPIRIKFGNVPSQNLVVVLGSVLGVSWLVSPATFYLATTRPIRLMGVLGSILISLGLLFTSFSTQFHQLYISLTLFTGIGISVIRESSTVILHQYFKKKRNLVEIIHCSTTGLGVLVMSPLMTFLLQHLEWRLAFQVLCVSMTVCIPLCVLYRPASLYHPQRRAMQHIKFHQKKIFKGRFNPAHLGFFRLNLRFLKRKSVNLLLLSSSIMASGILTPLYLLPEKTMAEKEVADSLLDLYLVFGASHAAGSLLAGLLFTLKSETCRISIKYQVQSSLVLTGVCSTTFSLTGGYIGHALFMGVYGLLLGATMVSLKLFVYSQTRRNENHTIWGLLQVSMVVPLVAGVYLTAALKWKLAYLISGVLVIVSAVPLFWCSIHNIRFRENPRSGNKSAGAQAGDSLRHLKAHPNKENLDAEEYKEYNVQQFLFDEYITSCNKVSNHVMEDELEQNQHILIKMKQTKLQDKDGREYMIQKFRRHSL